LSTDTLPTDTLLFLD